MAIKLWLATQTVYGQEVAIKDTSFAINDTRYTYQIHLKRKTQGQDTVCTIKSIVIADKVGQQVTQRIVPGENDQNCSMLDDAFVLEDMNFDGYADFRIQQFQPAVPNVPYYIWLFNPATKQFARNNSLEQITSPQVDRLHHRIRSVWQANCCDYGEDVYGFVANQLTLLQQTETQLDPKNENQTITTLKRRVDGQMRLISQVKAAVKK